MLPEIRAIDGRCISFADGSRHEFDTVLWATGFAASLPFLDDSLLRWRNGVPLRVGGLTVPLGPRRLYFVGLASPRGAQLPVYSAQAKLVARMLRLEPTLPEPLSDLLAQAGPPDDRIDILRPVWSKQMAAASRVLDAARPAQEGAS